MTTRSDFTSAADLQPISILFFHQGSVPHFLRCTLESARFFNPAVRLILITDTPTDLDWIKVETRLITDLVHPRLTEFKQNYHHISGLKFYYEQLFIARWFYLQQWIAEEKAERVLYLDSDAMLFSEAGLLFSVIPVAPLCTSRAGGPACTFIRGGLEEFLDFILTRYRDKKFLAERQVRSDLATAQGQLDGLGDMVFLELFTTAHPLGAVYPNDLSIGHIDHCVNIPDGLAYREIKHRKRQRKKIFWQEEAGVFAPYFRRQSDGQAVRALAIHFQSGAKRVIRRFNRVGADSFMPRTWRKSYYNWLHGGPLSEWL